MVNELLRAALDCAARSWHVFPLAPSGKKPAIKNWERRATIDVDRIRACWEAGNWNIGIACGPSGLLVVDLDRPKPGTARHNPDGSLYTGAVGYCEAADAAGAQGNTGDTYTVVTPSRGWHAYFTQPDGHTLGNSAGKVAELVDTRGAGGYVLAPGSVIDGKQYRVIRGHNPRPLPAWLTSLLAPPEVVARPKQPTLLTASAERQDERLAVYLAAAVRAETSAVAEAPEGGRNHRLYCASIALGQLVAGGHLTDTDATDHLTHAAHVCGLGQLEAEKTISSGLKAGAKNPRQLKV